MNNEAQLPIWTVVLAAGLAGQFFKFLIYSGANRKLDFSVWAQGHGLPSLMAVILSCLLATVVLREGWRTTSSGFCLVFAVIVIHDTVKLRLMYRRQREVVFHLVDSTPEAGALVARVVDYLDPRTHHPVHVGLGVLFGVLFALAFAPGGH